MHFHRRGLSKPAAFLAAGFILLHSSHAYSQAAPAPPVGCDSGLFTNLNPGNNITGITGIAGTSLAATEASTAQTLETIGQRRAQEALVCPADFVKVGGVCQPIQRNKPPVAEAVRSNRRAARTTVDQKPAYSTPSLVEPGLMPPRNAIWSEAFADYEQRNGLGTGQTTGNRSQRTAGFLVGADHAVQVGSVGLMYGVFGGMSDTRQKFNSSSNQTIDTNYVVDLSVPFSGQTDYLGNPYTGPTTFSYLLPTNHLLESSQSQTLRGPTLGFAVSVFKGGFFSDSVFKADFFNLNRNTISSDTFGRTLVADFEAAFGDPNAGAGPGCINRFDGGGNPRTATITNLQATLNATNQSTTAINLVYAQNVGYHFDLGHGLWIEPLAGARYSYSTYGSNAAALGLTDGQALRIQGGARYGYTSMQKDGALWTTSLATLVYSDVLVRGFVTNADGFSAGFLQADQNKLRFQGILSCRVDFQSGYSAFAEVQGRAGDDYWGVGGRIGGRYQW